MSMAPAAILTLNAGSSNIKFAVFLSGTTLNAILRGAIQGLETATPHVIAKDAAGVVQIDRQWAPETATTFGSILGDLLTIIDDRLGAATLMAVGHRVVHGGADHVAPERVTPDLMAAFEGLIALDPLHMPRNIEAMRAVSLARPTLPQVACFDTAFHRTQPLVASSFAIPRTLTAKGVRRFGFHGLSYEYIAACLEQQAPTLARGRVIVAHLGSGASLCALAGGSSIATTTGFSTLDGLMMATRCGNLDPGVIFYLLRQGHSADEIEDMLFNRSGLLGVSGVSGDMKLLLSSGTPVAREAIDLFVYRIVTEAGALVGALGGLDGLVFTAGTGEHSPAIRAAVCNRLNWLGLQLDASANAAGVSQIAASGSKIDVRVIATDEEAMIARHTLETIGKTTDRQE